MPISAAVILGLQIACGVHVVKTGRNIYWLVIIIMAPLLGCVIYFVAEIMPELTGSRTARSAASRAAKFVDPDRELRRLVEALETADTIDNRRALADEYLRRNDAQSALKLYESSLVGMHRDDPTLLLGLARARFSLHQFAGCVAALDALRAANPDYQSPDAHLLYARGLEGQERWQDARREYDAVSRYYPGAEAKCRYALILKRLGETEKARTIFDEVARALERAGKSYVREQREWYDLARSNLS